MKQFSLVLLVLLGAIIVAAGTLDLLRVAKVLAFSFNLFSPLLIVVLGLWIVACAYECRRWWKSEQ
jgi:hypothetical protein